MRNNPSDIDPSLIDLDSESKYMQSQTRGARRVKLNRGESWLMRFLPASLGPKHLWYARIGRHWHNQKPIFCPVHTSPDFGGDPDAYCPVCEVARELNDSENDAVSSIGYKAMGTAQWLTYGIVLQKSTGASTINMTESESMLVYEFNHYKSSFEELSQFYRNSVKPSNPKSVLDYLRGSDFWVNKTSKGLRLDKQDPQPIFDDLTDPSTDPRIKKLEEQMRTPKVQMPTEEELRKYADKLHDDAFRPSARGVREDRGGRGRGYEDLEDGGGEPEERPARSARSAPRRAPEDDDIPGAEVPARRPAPPATRTAPPARTAPRPEPEPEPEPPTAEEGGNEGEVDPEGGVEPPPRPARPAPAPATRSGAPTPRPAPAPATRTPAAAASQPAAASAPRRAPATLPPPPRGKTERVDDGEELPEERRDPAPPAEDPLPEDGTDVPPPVARPAVGNNTAAAIRNRIAGVSGRQA